MLNEVIQGDALEVLRSLPTHSVDAICSDPPSGINFMGKDWDKDKGGRDKWIDWLADIMSEALRVIKPGGHAFVWSLPRTSHWTATALEHAGWTIRDACVHIFGSGMPKSHNISKAIDRLNGAEREVIGSYDSRSQHDRHNRSPHNHKFNGVYTSNEYSAVTPITAPATPDAAQWEGWGTGLKPSHELWWLARSPLSEKSIAENVLKWGTGAINIDASRIGKDSTIRHNHTSGIWSSKQSENIHGSNKGRWPANLLLSHTLFCVPLGEKKVKGTAPRGKPSEGKPKTGNLFFNTGINHNIDHANPDGTETVQAWDCAPDCPVALLDMQSGNRKSGGREHRDREVTHNNNVYSPIVRTQGSMREASEGGASRYFQTFHETPDPLFIYTSKASRSERNKGCEALPASQTFDKNTSRHIAHINHETGKTTYSEYHPSSNQNNHPTVKPISLMRYLVTMITPPGGIVLDCFAGSGTTGVACIESGLNYILIEQDSSYCEIIRARLAYATQNAYTCKDNMTI